MSKRRISHTGKVNKRKHESQNERTHETEKERTHETQNRRSLRSGDGKMLPLASIFSGSEVFLLASDVLVKKLNRGLGVESRYGCEWKRPKRDFILKVIHNMPLGNKACLFHNAEAMSGAVAPCAVHGKDCWIPDGAKGPVAGAFGFSCKDFSSANNNPPQKKVMIQKGLGSSGKTARSLIDFLAMHPFPIVWLENVGELCSESHGQLHVLKELLANAGYIAK